MANYPSKFVFSPEWPALEAYLRDALNHEHEFGQAPGQQIDNLVSFLTQRDRQLEDYLATASSYLRFATKVVAASNSLDRRADFVCAGANDDTTIQSALDAAASIGGRVVLLEGSYNFSPGGGVTVHASTGLSGMGPSTQINQANTTFTNQTILLNGTGASCSDIQINATAAGQYPSLVVMQGGDQQVVERMTLVASVQSGNGGIVIQSPNNSGLVAVRNNLLVNLTNGIETSTSVGTINGLQVVGNVLLGTASVPTSLTVGSSAGGVAKGRVAGNVLCGARLSIINQLALIVAENEVYGSNDKGLFLSGCSRLIVKGNRIEFAQNEGILDQGGNDNEIAENYVYNCSQQSPQHNDGILIGGGAATSNDYVHGNVVRGTQHKYGLELNSGSTNTAVMNDLHASGGTGNFSDTATGTIKNLDGSTNNWNRVT